MLSEKIRACTQHCTSVSFGSETSHQSPLLALRAQGQLEDDHGLVARLGGHGGDDAYRSFPHLRSGATSTRYCQKLGYMTDITDPFEFWKDRCQFQIGQCRVLVNLTATHEFYKNQPKITDNCTCGDCQYFSDVVIEQNNKLFDLLKKMKVDLQRQPNINPDGVCCVDLDNGKKGYIGYYYVIGELRKTTKNTKVTDDGGKTIEVSYKNAEFGKGLDLTIKQADKDKLIFDFYLEVNGSSEKQ